MSVNDKIVADMINNQIEFVTTVPCKQLAAVAIACGCENVVECPAEAAAATVKNALDSNKMTIVV